MKKINLSKKAIYHLQSIVLKLILLAVFIVASFGFIFGITAIKGEGMYPRVRDGDLVLFYRLQDEEIGDAVIYKKDGIICCGRVVAQAGDTVDINESGEFLVNGSVQSEEIFYPTEKAENSSISFPYAVPEDSVFILNDFRTNSSKDSRVYGAISKSDIKGTIIFLFRKRGI